VAPPPAQPEVAPLSGRLVTEEDIMNASTRLDGYEFEQTEPGRAWPFYIVFDVSKSMWGPHWEGTSPHAIMNDSLAMMTDTLSEHEAADAVCWLEVVTFAEEARTLFPLSAINQPHHMPPLPKGEWTNYVAVWSHLAETIPQNVRDLQGRGYVLDRPVVFFITDGNAGSKNQSQLVSSWKPMHDALCRPSFRERPRIVALGMGSVNRETILALRSTDPQGAACLADPTEPASTLLTAIIGVIVNSIKDSTHRGVFDFKVPQGMIRLDDGKD
jgi:uncharacterized protein YegL